MRILHSFFISLFIYCYATAQTDTDIYLFDLTHTDDGWSLTNPINISNNEGYDNQPSFSPDGYTLYYSSHRNGETDLVAYNTTTGSQSWLTNTSSRSEYSPTITPDSSFLSFISLTNDGVQEFRKIHLGTGKETLIESNPIIGYFVWITPQSYLCFVLPTNEQPATLQIHHTATGEKIILGERPGRSFHQIPSSNAVSYIQNIQDEASIFSYQLETDDSELIGSTLENSQDMAWLPTGEIIMGKGSELFINKGNDWYSIGNFENYSIYQITRIAINSTGTKIALVAEE
jgi:Tol biopolymer transport system component